MIKTVKLSLRNAIGRGILNWDELNTVLIEVEAIVNVRPLTYVEEGEYGLNYSLTPPTSLMDKEFVQLPILNIMRSSILTTP